MSTRLSVKDIMRLEEYVETYINKKEYIFSVAFSEAEMIKLRECDKENVVSVIVRAY